MSAIDFPTSPADGQTTADGRFYFDSSVGSSGAWRSTPLPVGGLPAGSIIAWSTNTPPANWLIADGSAVSRSTYSSLFAAIGTQYGVGNGTTTFNLPDLRGRIPVGRDGSQTEFDVLGETGGAKTHALTVSEMPSHSHDLTKVYGGNQTYDTGSSSPAGMRWETSSIVDSGDIMSTGGGQAHNNLQPYQVVNYIIKFSAGWTAGDSELATRVGVVETGINSLKTASPTVVANVAERDSLFPSPTQGNAVFRTDIGSTERFFSAYNASTNPGGERVAGWYPSHDGGLVPLLPTSIDSTGNSNRTVSINSSGLVSFSGCLTVSLNGIFSDKYKMYRLVVPNHGVSGGTNIYIRARNAGTDRGTYFRTGMIWYTNSTGQYWGGYGESLAYLCPAGTPNGFSIVADFALDGALFSSAYGQNGGGTLLSATVSTYFLGSGDGLTLGLDNSSARMGGTFQLFGYRS